MATVTGKASASRPNAVQSAAIQAAEELRNSAPRRREIPIRNSFVRSEDPLRQAPLARLVSTRGRGGSVPVLLYIALIWRCSAPPFSTDLQARKWATLLGLDDPRGHGARRISNALDVLERQKLLSLERRPGEPSVITLLAESGDGAKYQLPSTAYARAKTTEAKSKHRYFKVPIDLWTTGEIQSMSGASLAMLLILIAERNTDGRPTWWSTERFPSLFSISPSMRAKGTRDLEARGLLVVTKQSVPDGKSAERVFARERVRNLYTLARTARPLDMRQKNPGGSRITYGDLSVG